jgi:O-methyltransferase domain
VKERLIDGADTSPETPFLVVIGGNVGHDLMAFHRQHKNTPGKLILQDLPVVVGEIKDLDPAIMPMGHDFFKEQPIKGEGQNPPCRAIVRSSLQESANRGLGVYAYYIHSVLHDWSDDVCMSIPTHITAAMKPGYSKLLINENVLPPTGQYWEAATLDMAMLTLFCSKERTEADWHHLLEKMAGLKIVKIWAGSKGVESLIESELSII